MEQKSPPIFFGGLFFAAIQRFEKGRRKKLPNSPSFKNRFIKKRIVKVVYHPV